ncbi:hypothetical protein, partial [Nocardia sp. NPDC059228]|uniref:hypothetical protein n=1 Tax=Nocardia sp. NPDC059228 TaxID=3346777 RepID=UPI0036883F3E
PYGGSEGYPQQRPPVRRQQEPPPPPPQQENDWDGPQPEETHPFFTGADQDNGRDDDRPRLLDDRDDRDDDPEYDDDEAGGRRGGGRGAPLRRARFPPRVGVSPCGGAPASRHRTRLSSGRQIFHPRPGPRTICPTASS